MQTIGALWKRGRNKEFVVGKVQGAVDKVVEWGKDWGCRFSWADHIRKIVEKSNKCNEVLDGQRMGGKLPSVKKDTCCPDKIYNGLWQYSICFIS